MSKRIHEIQYNINQSDRSLYSMLTDAHVGFFWDTNFLSKEDLAPKTFASEPNGGVLTQSWLVLMKTFQNSSSIEELCVNAKTLEKSKEVTEIIAGETLLWAISNHKSVRRRRKSLAPIDENVLNDLLKD